MICQGICTANCESKASHLQRIHMKDIVMGWIELTDGVQYHIRIKWTGQFCIFKLICY